MVPAFRGTGTVPKTPCDSLAVSILPQIPVVPRIPPATAWFSPLFSRVRPTTPRHQIDTAIDTRIEPGRWISTARSQVPVVDAEYG